ncbi:type II toxin-antitoxin system YafQ family toxin [Olsenella sp. kh2p3]|jgi:mRNA interferase YafQ|uniref:type II toxin-antitoxin system RelE/ParE family toxin n=1 Tax=Olsenella sp. kh2p3 TaxID=1797112 RepID=UPI000922642D|nr:mRNA interferase YafQ [Olsenella sp. kh2p3]
MYSASFTPRFLRDVKACKKRHWDEKALKAAISDLLMSDTCELDNRYRDHALTGALEGYRSIHVDSAPNPPKDKWVLMYRLSDTELMLVRTGTHDEVYGKKM